MWRSVLLFCFLVCIICVAGSASRSLAAQDAPLSVITMQPQGLVEPLTQITVRFSEAMRPLGNMTQDASTSPLQLRVPGGILPPGNFRWQDPATLSYLFDHPVNIPLRIEARVPADILALSGTALAQDVAFKLHTPPLKLEAEANKLPPTGGHITLRSNYPLSPDSLKQKLALTQNHETLAFELHEMGSWQEGRGRNTWPYRLEVTSPLTMNQEVHLRCAPGLTARSGGEAAAPREWKFSTFGDLFLIGWSTGHDREKNQPVQPEEGVRVSFNNPVSYKNFLDHLDIVPPVAINPEMVKDSSEPSSDSYFTLPFQWQARTRYQISLRSDLQDIYGGTFASDENLSFSFTTGDFAPFFHMQTGNVIMERNQGGLYPLHIRNISPISIRLRYYPEPAELLKHLSVQKNTSSKNAAPLPAAERDYTTTLDFSKQFNTNIVHMLDIPQLLGLDAASMRGVTLLEVRTPPSDHKKEENLTARLQLTDLGLTFKNGRDASLAWVTSLDKGIPVENAQLRLLDEQNTVLWEGISDREGLARLPGRNTYATEPATLIATTEKDHSILLLSSMSFSKSYSDRLDAEPERRSWAAHMIAQLPLYQPGQTVRFTLYAGMFTDMEGDKRLEAPTWLPVAEEPLELVIRDSRRKVVHSQTSTSNTYGSISGEFTLSTEASLGSYSFSVQTPRFTTQTSGDGFRVAEFRLPEFTISLDAPASRPTLLPEEVALQTGVTAGYFSGAPLPAAAVSLRVSQDETGFSPALLRGYKTGPDDSDLWPLQEDETWLTGLLRSRGKSAWWDETFFETTLQGTLDEQGKTVFILPSLPVKPFRSQRVTLEATVTDSTGLTSQSMEGFTLYPASIYVGLRCPRFVPMDSTVIVDIKAATWDNKPVERAEILLRAERMKHDGRESEPVWEKTLHVISAQGQAFELRFDKSGAYRLSALVTDEHGRKNISVATIYVAGPDLDWISNRPHDFMEMMSDKAEYVPGETANVVLKNPFAKALALITLERGGVRSHELREVSGPSPTIEVPLKQSDAPYVYVNITLVRGRIAEPDIPGDRRHDLASPQVAHGTLLLKVTDPDDPGLYVTLSTDKEHYRPGDNVKVAVRIADRHGQGKKTQITLLAVDDRVLRAAGERLYDPATTFTQLFSYGVHSIDGRLSLLNLSSPILKTLAHMAEPRTDGIAYMTKTDSSPMNRSYSVAAAGTRDTVRDNFSPTAFWLAEGETDENGTLSLNFSLPDSLTSYRLVAVASDTRHFAVSQHTIIVNKPLQLVSALPGFLTEGDTLEAKILVQNLDSAELDIRLNAIAQGLKLEHNTASLRLEAGSSATVVFPVTADEPGLAVFTINATAENEQDAARFSLPILPAAPLTTVAASGLLREGTESHLPLALPTGLDPRSSLEVLFAPSPAAGMTLAGQELLAYPWDCLEQRLSRAWLRALRLRHGDLLGLPADPKDREQIQATLDSVHKFQVRDGGFSFWPGMEHSNVYLTAYVLLVNSQTTPLGLSLDDDLAKAALDRLRTYLSNAYSNSKDMHTSEAEALALWHVARSDDELARELFPKVLEQAENQGIPLTWSALLLVNDILNRSQADVHARYEQRILVNLEKLATITPIQMHFAARRDYGYWRSLGSTLRDNGMVLAALTGRSSAAYPRLDALAHWIGQGLGETRILSTQESIFGIWGLTEYLQSLGGDQPVQLQAAWKNQTMTKSFARLLDAPQSWHIPAQDLVGGERLDLRALSGNPYWTARLRYRDTAARLLPENAGFSLVRSWTPRQADKNLCVGDLVDVTVTLTVPATRRHVLLFDPFPAGLEPLYASRVDLANTARRYQPPWQFQESRKDGMVLYAERVDPGTYRYTYTLRAAAVGDFSQRPSRVEEMYSPEVFGQTTDDRVVIAP